LTSVGRFKDLLVADETRYRRVLFGVCKGNYLPMNLRYRMRTLLGLYEPEIAGYVRAYARPGVVCYDAGAADGYYSLAFAKLVAPAPVYAFEADAGLCRVLSQTLEENRHLRSKVEVRNVFLGANVDRSANQVSLDHLVFQEGLLPPRLIKMDIEGGEYAVLSGASRVLNECRPNLILEVHSPQLETDCQKLLKSAGYDVRIIKNSRLAGEGKFRPLELNRWLCAEPC
jgi:predicted RNA methylase